MTTSKFLNVYSGPQALKQYFDPDEQPLLPLVELPASLNPLLDDGVHIYAKMLTALPAQNIKALPALNMIQNAIGKEKNAVLEASSGSTVISLSLASRVVNQNDDVTAYVTNKTERSRLQTLSFFGLKVNLYGGPSQPEISDERGIMQKINRWAQEDDKLWAPSQYENEYNYRSHIRWTGPQLLKQLPNISVFCAGMGSAGCITGTGIYLKEHKPGVKVIGTGDPVPGPRPAPLFENIPFPWKTVVDEVEEVDSAQSYRLSMRLSREGLISGPSSGMALQALLSVLQRAKAAGRLSEYAGPDGKVRAVFPCCDLPYQYMDNYFKKLDASDFHPIINEVNSSFLLDDTVSNVLQHLLDIDTHTYNPAWELNAAAATALLGGEPVAAEGASSSNVQVIDIRAKEDFSEGTLPGAKNLSFSSVKAGIPSPFDDVALLESQWLEMKARLSDGTEADLAQLSSPVLTICYNGESARMLTSILRAQGVDAYSVKGGISSLLDLIHV
ncbi:hypothetical protein E8E14_012186 [Neopestalotiopsis sp. 37M]|nr:hypothetical protein E8E14_012186 [Neopestalotiopsis sp. 37M]